MECISVFEIFKIGVGPSSSHTMGPWRAALDFLSKLDLPEVEGVKVVLYGSLSKTGRGHGTDIAVQLGLLGEDPVTIPTDSIPSLLDAVSTSKSLMLDGRQPVPFDPEADIHFSHETLPFHPNGLTFTAALANGSVLVETYYSVGGGFIVQEGQASASSQSLNLPHPMENAAEMLKRCEETGQPIHQLVRENEREWGRTDAEIDAGLLHIWHAMRDCIHRGCRTGGILPGGLNVTRRAQSIHDSLNPNGSETDSQEWLEGIKNLGMNFESTTRWVSCFALAVNEENAAFGRVVTAPTNGAAGVIPAVLMYAAAIKDITNEQIIEFLLTAGQIGILFKRHATISAAMGGCQAEIGVSSAMAAAGLTSILGGSPGQVCAAAEIAMEHHLGMTCDPIGGLVQIPCIERNTMGAMKAIQAQLLAVDSDPKKAKVSLDQVIGTMWRTALDMNNKYKETAEGGLALIPVNVAEC